MGKYPKPTKLEADRISLMMELGCVACAAIELWCRADECHHLLQGNKRMGHWFTIPLCAGHHRGHWGIEQIDALPARKLVALSDGRKRFNSEYPTEKELWEKVQDRLHLVKNWPESKILPWRPHETHR